MSPYSGQTGFKEGIGRFILNRLLFNSQIADHYSHPSANKGYRTGTLYSDGFNDIHSVALSDTTCN